MYLFHRTSCCAQPPLWRPTLNGRAQRRPFGRAEMHDTSVYRTRIESVTDGTRTRSDQGLERANKPASQPACEQECAPREPVSKEGERKANTKLKRFKFSRCTHFFLSHALRVRRQMERYVSARPCPFVSSTATPAGHLKKCKTRATIGAGIEFIGFPLACHDRTWSSDAPRQLVAQVPVYLLLNLSDDYR